MPRRLHLACNALLLAALAGCSGGDGGDAPAATATATPAPLGGIVEFASAEQRASFERGQALATHRFTAAEGHGPAFNVDSCAACHEKPVTGGSAGRYRNFNFVAEVDGGGGFTPTGVNGIQPQFTRAPVSRVATDAATNLIATRNPIPFFGVGLLSEIPDAEIRRREDPSDSDGDGISGRTNLDNGRLGRFGRKAQSASVEAFIRGPLFNHLGITSDPLPAGRRRALPLQAALADPTFEPERLLAWLGVGTALAQASAPDMPTRDADGVPDPELGEQALFDLVSFTLLLAPPEPDPPTAETQAGRALFEQVGCGGCHVPALDGPRGPVAAYTDLLLHDMGPELADGLRMGRAEGSEFRTQPLWGVAATGPYLHDGRADSLDQAIRLHGGEAAAAAAGYAALSAAEREQVVAFLASLGGRSQHSAGLIPPDAPVPPVGEFGGPARPLSGPEAERYARGRREFDRESGLAEGLGPLFNGDSCRACHFDPVPGGAGPIDVNVLRHGVVTTDGEFQPPEIGTLIHRFAAAPDRRASDASAAAANVFEMRQTPPMFGLGLIERIPGGVITAAADPGDADGDGVSGRAHRLADGRLGRFGWKAQVPSLAEFARDALSNELGLSVPAQPGRSFGTTSDDDAAADPEIAPAALADLTFFMQELGPPPPRSVDPDREADGRALFRQIGCAACHTPSMTTADGTQVPLYSDLLLHDVQPPGFQRGIVDGDAGQREFRTPPLWGLRATAPYWHDGRADTLTAAIERHAGEALGAREAFEALTADERATLTAFLESL